MTKIGKILSFLEISFYQVKTDSKPISNRYNLSVGDHYLNSCGSDSSTKEVEAGGWQV